jgi:hypothetical protein
VEPSAIGRVAIPVTLWVKQSPASPSVTRGFLLEANHMSAWSIYLREQAIIADRVSRTMTNPESQKEFADIASSYRRDADIEDASTGSDSNCPPLSEIPRRRPSQAHATC